VLLDHVAYGNAIGGTDAGNVISGNATDGVNMEGTDTSANGVAGNWIGTDASGTQALPNGSSGVLVWQGANGNTIGGRAAIGNTIAFNSFAGVAIEGSDLTTNGITIEGNSIEGNGFLGIGFFADANDGQASPVLTAVGTVATTTIEGTLDSAASTDFRIELFASPDCDDSGAGEGAQFLGSVGVTTNAGGHASFTKDVPAVPDGEFVTATATNESTGDTSQFSDCFQNP